MLKNIIVLVFILALTKTLQGIETIHHDKLEETKIAMAARLRENQKVPFDVKQPNSNADRQKRLLPYINYYRQAPPRNPEPGYKTNEYSTESERVTPFLETNSLPGSFVPIHHYRQNQPNYQEIYEQLSQLKHNPRYNQPTILIPVQNYNQNYRNAPQAGKTTIETYTPTQIDITAPGNYYRNPKPNNQIYKVYRPNKPQQYIEPNYVLTIPQKPYFREKVATRKPPIYFYSQNAPVDNKVKPVIYALEEGQPIVNTIVDDRFEAQKIPKPQLYEPVQFVPTPVYEPITTTPQPSNAANTLSLLLKQLQDTNTLPHELTLENVDNSIRTLVKILNNLRKQQKLTTKPIVVAEEELNDEENEDDEETNSEHFPENTIEGGTPGRPGVDYPALSTIPPTSFRCKTQRYKGFFGDPDTNCQVWHYCDLNGGQASFLCPNGTIFSQVALTCDWWYNVKCDNTAQLYVLNERLYKYILPLSPKFPEDYSGPLVDKYLALKFREMEDKMNKDKEKDQESSTEKEEDDEKDDSDQLKDAQRRHQEKIDNEKT